ncbi:hypothetical protein V6N13_102818 [Hibiscus sabdariffa]|uniref:Uncharacterized protein n=1 Tax=Hibiscus sabdariffa TaxID=183260 RepID=A0ABR2D631_9ROSI
MDRRKHIGRKPTSEVHNRQRMHDHPLLPRPETVVKSGDVVESAKSLNNYAKPSNIGKAVKYRIDLNLSMMVRSKSAYPKLHEEDSQTTRQFFITKNTGVNLTGAGQVFKDAIVRGDPKRNIMNHQLKLMQWNWMFCRRTNFQNNRRVQDSLLSKTVANTELPDMNKELLAFTKANSTNDGGISNLKTRSLDVEHLICHAKQPLVSAVVACRDVLGHQTE